MGLGVNSRAESRREDAEQGISGGISNGARLVTYIINTGGRPLGQQPERNQSQGLHQWSPLPAAIKFSNQYPNTPNTQRFHKGLRWEMDQEIHVPSTWLRGIRFPPHRSRGCVSVSLPFHPLFFSSVRHPNYIRSLLIIHSVTTGYTLSLLPPNQYTLNYGNLSRDTLWMIQSKKLSVSNNDYIFNVLLSFFLFIFNFTST